MRKGGIGQEQSSRNWGWVRISRRDPREVPLMVEALRKRQDGGYTIVSGHENVVDIVPKSFSLPPTFCWR